MTLNQTIQVLRMKAYIFGMENIKKNEDSELIFQTVSCRIERLLCL